MSNRISRNCSKENDREVGLTKAKVTKLSSPVKESGELKRIREIFLSVAGGNEEIGWQELKEILTTYAKEENSTKIEHVGEVNATPEETGQNNNLISSIVGLLCGAFCKDTPLIDLVPSATQVHPVNSSYVEMAKKAFSKDVCRSMIAMLDSDRSGKLNYYEFEELYRNVTVWKNVFKNFDKNSSGTLSGFELRDALNSAGYNLNNHTLNVLMHRFGNKDCQIEFDDFIMCAVKLKSMIEFFKSSSNQSDVATFTLEEWIIITLYA